MKGIVFTELLDYVGRTHGEDTVDDIIRDCALPSGGAYTAVGTYDHAEMTALCSALSARTRVPLSDLMRGFGDSLIDTFSRHYPQFFDTAGSLLDFIQGVESHIHFEVRKLYPQAELPRFLLLERSETRLVMLYSSPRRMADLAEGLILGAARKFGRPIKLHAAPLVGSDGQVTRFEIEYE